MDFKTGFSGMTFSPGTFAFVYRFNDLWYDSMPISIRDNVMGALTAQIANGCSPGRAGPEISLSKMRIFRGHIAFEPPRLMGC